MNSLIQNINNFHLSECCHIIDYAVIDLPLDKIYFSDTYQRFLIYRDEKYTVFLITWKAGQSSSYHSHSSAGCLFKIISGQLKEVRLMNLNNETEFMIDNNSGSRYIDNDIAIHKIEAMTDTISLHFYSPTNEINKTYIDMTN